jgi:hypothetical protein
MNSEQLKYVSEDELYGLADALFVDYVGERLTLDELRNVVARLLNE